MKGKEYAEAAAVFGEWDAEVTARELEFWTPDGAVPLGAGAAAEDYQRLRKELRRDMPSENPFKEIVLSAVRDRLSHALDNLRKAQNTFQGLGARKMAEEYGDSGAPRSAILTQFAEDARQHEMALEWLKAVFEVSEAATALSPVLNRALALFKVRPSHE